MGGTGGALGGHCGAPPPPPPRAHARTRARARADARTRAHAGEHASSSGSLARARQRRLAQERLSSAAIPKHAIWPCAAPSPSVNVATAQSGKAPLGFAQTRPHPFQTQCSISNIDCRGRGSPDSQALRLPDRMILPAALGCADLCLGMRAAGRAGGRAQLFDAPCPLQGASKSLGASQLSCGMQPLEIKPGGLAC